jgi:membrane-associated phospholipid phosphatase
VKWATLLTAFGLFFLPAPAAQATAVETAGDALQIFLLTAAGGMTLALDDYEGLRQFAKSGTFTLMTTQVLKVTIDSERPNGAGRGFPSGHTAAAFAGASFIQRRYGWRYGIPAYGMAAFVAWSRVDADKHYVEDVVGGAALAIVSTYLFTEPLPRGLNVVPEVGTDHFGIFFIGRW